MSQKFEAFLFDTNEETGRKKVSIYAKNDGIAIPFSQETKTILWPDLILKYGGSNGRQLFFKTRTDETLVLFTSDLSIIKSIEENAGRHKERVLDQIKKGGFLRFLNSPKFFLYSSAVLIIGLCLFFYFGMPIMKKMAAKTVPVDAEIVMGEKIFEQYIKDYKVIDSPEIKTAINKIHERIKIGLKDQPFSINYYVVNDSKINAFALPGGYVVIHSELILQSGSAEELAGVISHEISHVTQRHAVERIISNLGIAVAAQILLGDISGLSTIIIQGAQLVTIMQFSQSQETEADTKGFELLKAAKISPMGIIDFFERQNKKKNETSKEIESKLNFISTHPPDEKRIKNLKALFDKNHYEPEKLDIDWEEVKNALKKQIAK